MIFVKWLLFVLTSTVCTVYLIRFIRKIVRYFYLTAKAPQISFAEYCDFYFNGLFKDEAIAKVDYLTVSRDYKPWAAWLGSSFGLMISDYATAGEVFKNKNIFDKPHVFYNAVSLLLGKGLVTLNGPNYKPHRKIVIPAFTTASQKLQLPRINEHAETLVRRLRKTNSNKNIRDLLSHQLNQMSWSIFASDRFSDECLLDSMEAIKVGLRDVQLRETNPLYYWFVHVPKTSIWKQGLSVMERMEKAKHFLIQQKNIRKRIPVERERATNVFDLMVGKDEITDDEFCDHAMTFAAGGHQTTETTICSSLAMLALHQDVQQRLYEEILTKFSGSNRPVDADDLASMPYLDMVVKEAMRLYPPIALLGKKVQHETLVGDVLMPSGSSVCINVFSLHRNPNVFEDPLTFNPDRFSPENSQKYHPFAYIPFSIGSRSCPSQIQGLITIKTFLCHILKNFKIFPGDKLKSMDDVRIKMYFVMEMVELSVLCVSREECLQI